MGGSGMANNIYDYDEQERARIMAERRRQRAEAKRRHIRKQRIFFGSILLIFILIILLIVRGCSKAKEKRQENADPAQIEAQTPETPEVTDPEAQEEPAVQVPTADLRTVSIASVGDIMMYDNQIAAATQPNGTYDFTPCFEKVSSYLSGADITTANLETTFTDGYDYTGSVPYFNAPVTLADDMASVGFDVISTANTYSILYGVSGLYSTIGHVRSAGMLNVGTFYTQDERNTDGGAQFVEVNGVKVAFLAYTKNVNDMFVPEGSEYAVNILYEDYCDTYDGIKEEMLISDVKAAKAAGADIVIVLAHWGSEYVFTTRSPQEGVADLLFENGVDAIIGCHSHVVNAMETRTVTTVDGEQKEVFIAYGLGNFLSSMNKDYTRETVILNLEFEKDMTSGSVSLKNVNYVPCYIMETGPDGQTKYQVVNIHDEISNYLGGKAYSVDEETYNTLTASLDSIHNHAGAEFDVGGTPVEEPTVEAGQPQALPAASPGQTAQPSGGVAIPNTED